MKEAALGSGQASGIMSIGDNVRNLAEKRLMSYAMSAQKKGIDLDKLGEQELKYMLEMNKPKPPKVIAADSPEGKGITEALLGKKGEVFSLQGEKLDPNLPISGGSQQGKKLNRKFFERAAEAQEVEKRIQSGVAATVEKMLRMEPLDAMKEANKVIKREGPYKNLSKRDARNILDSTEDHIFDRVIKVDEFEDFAGGGVAGMLGERPGYRRGGRRGNTGQASQSLSKSSNQGPAGGASAGGNYGGNRNPSQTYGGSIFSGGGGGENQNNGGGGGGEPPSITTTEPSFKERTRQKQILNYLKSLEEEELASGFGRGKILGGIFKSIKPRVGPKELGIEYFKDNPFGDSLKLNLDTKIKDLLKGEVEPKLKLEGNKGNLKYGFDIDTDKNFNFGIRMPFGKQPPGKKSLRNKFAPDISQFNIGDMTGINPLVFADGGPARQNFKMGRRAFLKMLAGVPAGIAALKTGITGLGGKKVATEVAKEAVTTSSGTVPPYFFNLVKKIKNLGDDVTSKSATTEREKVTKYKDYELTEDLTTGEQTIQKVKLSDDAPQYYDETLAEETYMNYKPGKGQADETTGGKVADEYTEDTSYLRTSGPQKGEIVDTVDGVGDDVIQEGTMFEDDITDFTTKKLRTKKAGGGVAYMLGQ
jgi:hypothetical protein